MSTTYTPNVKLAMPGPGDPNWNVAVNGNCTSIDGQAPVGGLAVSVKEVPSASLNVAIAGGNYLKQDGTIATFAGVSSRAMGASTTNYVYLDVTNSGTLVVNTTGFPITAHVRLAVVGTGAGTVTSIVDSRVAFEVVGSILDGTQWTVGTSSGLQIGTASTQKLGFFGRIPAVQPTMGSATAGSSYTSTEQAMLQAVYNAVRALGLGS